MAISDYLVTDDLTVLLGLIAVTVFLLHNLYKPQALVHPILLGRQSDVGRVRNPGESALYRNYATGLLGRFAVKPDKDVSIISDFVKPDLDTPHTLWSTKISNPQLKERISAFASGLVRFAGLVPHEDNVLLLLNDGLDFLISDFALASLSIPSFTISSPSLLSPVLESHPPSAIITHGYFLSHVLELIYDSNESEHHIVIVVGDFDPNVVGKAGNSVKVVKWTDVESAGTSGEPITSVTPGPDDVFTVSFFTSEAGRLQGAHLTHTNFTAGVAAIRALLPQSNAISSLDTIISAHSLGTPFGRAVAYTAIYEGSSFCTLNSTKLFTIFDAKPDNDVDDILAATKLPISSPTILFIKPVHLQSMSTSVTTKAKKSSLLYSFANRHKMSGLTDGFITKDSLWDRMVFDDARLTVLGDSANTVRAVVTSGSPLESSYLTPARIALSVFLINSHTHPVAAGPLFASHPIDLQIIPASSGDPFAHIAHVGPPSANIEAKLVGVKDESVDNGADPVGMLMVRGPSVGKVLGVGEDSYVEVPSSSDEGWVVTGERAKVLANGAFKVAGQSLR